MLALTERHGSSAGSWNATPIAPLLRTRSGGSPPIVASAGVDAFQAERDPEQRRLSATGRADQRRQGPRRAVEGDAVEDGERIAADEEALGDVRERDGPPARHEPHTSSSSVVSNISRVALMPIWPSASMFFCTPSSSMAKTPFGCSISGFCAVLK